MGQFSLRISPATISNMKIILALFGFFLTARCLPAPGVTFEQECEGSKGLSNSAFGSGFDTAAADVAFRQRCKDGKCKKNSAFGVDFSDSDTWTIQRCQGSNCQQKTAFGRKKRAVVIEQEYQSSQSHNNVVGDGEQEMKTFVCAGGLVSSSCDSTVCEITCSDNTQYQHDCGSLTSQVSSTPGTDGSTVVTVSCGAEPISYPSCFPFCSDSEEESAPTMTQPQDLESATTLKSCIDACPVATTYRGCVTSCLNNSPSNTVAGQSSQNCSGSQCSQNNGFNGANTGNSPFPFPDCFPFCN